MSGRPLFIDASFFLSMHAANETHRRRSVTYFAGSLSARPRMNFEQIGICDAVIWKESRHVQDLYYPFMDRLHTDMAIDRGGYGYDDIEAALSHPELKDLTPERAFLVGQVLRNDGRLASHDPVLLPLDCLRGRHWDEDEREQVATFPGELQTLYEASRAFVHGNGEMAI